MSQKPKLLIKRQIESGILNNSRRKKNSNEVPPCIHTQSPSPQKRYNPRPYALQQRNNNLKRSRSAIGIKEPQNIVEVISAPISPVQNNARRNRASKSFTNIDAEVSPGYYEGKLSERLKGFQPKEIMERFVSVKNLFEEFLGQNPKHRNFLNSTKKVYDNYVEKLEILCRKQYQQIESYKKNHENDRLRRLCSKFKEELKTQRSREKKLVKIIVSLKRKVSGKRSPNDSSRLQKVKSQHNIPLLPLKQIGHQRSPTSYQQDSPSLQIPKLQLPTENKENFHDEFLAMVDEFSESWILQMKRDNR